MAAFGDRVLARWTKEKDWWYPGVVVGSQGSMVEVVFDDGDRATVNLDETRPLQVPAGKRVYCRWKGGAQYYPGQVRDSVGSAITIDYDDGDKEATSVSFIRINAEDL